MVTRARAIAAEVLTRVERDDAFATVALEAALASERLEPRDAALASELVLGTLRRKLALEAALELASERSFDKIEAALKPLLRLGAYQLLYLDRVPDHAAVGETVELCKERGLARAAGLCNAVLRRLAREPKVPLPEEPLSRLSIEESHPLWLVQRWAQAFGLEEARALCRANNQPAELHLRVNLTRATREGVIEALRSARPDAEVAAGRYAPTAVTLSHAGQVTKLPGFAEGHFQVQDEAAQLIGLLVAPTPGRPTLDVCAAPGGKSCHLAELGGEVVALDVSAKKLERVKEEAERLGLRLRCVAADAQNAFPVAPGSQAFILVDAPCSGLGTLRRHPELRYRRRESDLPALVDVQRRILSRALEALAPGGVLVFSVCSAEPEESVAHRTALLAEHPELSPEASPLLPPSDGAPWKADGQFLSLPHRHGLDGFGGFRLRRS